MIYYFDIRVGERLVRDLEGSEYSDVQAAQSEAVKAAREMMADAIRRGEDISDGVFEISDEHFQIVARMSFHHTVRRTN